MKMRFILKCIIIFIFCCALRVSGLCGNDISSIKIDQRVSTDTITIGDRFNYKFSIAYDPKVLIDDLSPAEWLRMFEIKDYDIKGPKKKLFSDELTKRWNYTLSTYTTGYYLIPSVGFNYLDEKGEKYTINTDSITIRVVSVAKKEGDRDDVRDIKGQRRAHYPLWLYFLVVGVLVLIGGGIFGYYLYTTKKLPSFLQKKEEKPAHIIALRELEELKESDFISRGQVKTYYIHLSEILKKYLEKRFKIPVLDKTTHEAYYVLRETEIDKKLITDIKSFLEECDLVKFAKYMPDTPVTDEHYAFVEKVVEITKRVDAEIADN